MIDESRDVIPALSVGPFQATVLGLFVLREPTWEECKNYGLGLQIVAKAMPLLVGDWLNIAERYFPKSFTQAVSLTGLNPETLRNWKWITSRVPASRRRDALYLTHYALVAPLEPPEQERWLKVAKEEEWSTRELKEAINPTGNPGWKEELLDVLRALMELSEGHARDLAERAIGILRAHR